MAPPKKGTLAERFWSFIVPSEEGCWGWEGPLSTYGYGVLSVGHRGEIKAHRLSWEIHNGPVPEGLCVLHKCDVRSCNRPDHLWLGTRRDNTLDMFSKGRDRRSIERRQQSAML